MSNLAEYDGHKFFDASKEDLKIGKDKSEKNAEKKLRVLLWLRFAPLPPVSQTWSQTQCSIMIHVGLAMCIMQGEYKELTKWWKDQLGREVQGVKVSKRLHDTPLVVVTSKFGWSANMERIMKAQVCPAEASCVLQLSAAVSASQLLYERLLQQQ